MERALYISKFRNIGFEKDERIVLNNSIEKGKMGNLVIIVGANNSGKSNVLSALTAFANNQISDRDITNLSFEEKDHCPTLSLCVKDGEDEFYYRINKESKISYGFPEINSFNYLDNHQLIIDFLEDIKVFL